MKGCVEFFRDFYGCTASIHRNRLDTVVKLTVRDAYGKLLVIRRPFRSYRGCRIAMGHMSDGWTMTGKEEE